MLKKIKSGVLVLTLAGVLMWGYASFADTAGSPGSTGDPLVTKSFVEKYVQDFMSNFKPAGSTEWQVVQLAPGKVMVANEGTELIVRSGKTVLVDSTTNGVPDLTTGNNIIAGQQPVKNHLLIFPRSDGRGIKAVESAWIMYKGSVDIK
ncbi:hypothetical protein [Desulfolucanica intricata]|uniref:hypothetical protein n=1 Tax=Desulfolucanica intricata TaxID=1285191 RepID=UPI00082D96C0|nr:hypothetical protein [Desulfolucanica intricata]